MGKVTKEWLSALDTLLLNLAHQRVTPEVLRDDLAQFCVDELGAAFARIWLIDESRTTLVLKTSRGQYTRLDGTRSRIPLGNGSKIDLVFANCLPHITNDVLTDPAVKDKDWATREGFVSFAGMPLCWGGEKLGVLGMYSREVLSEDLLQVLAIFTSMASAVIYQQNQTERNMLQFCEVTGFKRTLLDRLISLGVNKKTESPVIA